MLVMKTWVAWEQVHKSGATELQAEDAPMSTSAFHATPNKKG